MRIKLLTGFSGPDICLSNGDEADFDDAEAIRLIEAGFAVPVAKPVERAVKKPKETRTK